jgi:hypothetical protein
LLGRAPEPAQLPPTRVEVGWARERGWEFHIAVALPKGERRREVDVRTCADGFDVVALTLALILDPNLDAGGESLLDLASSSEAAAPLADPTPEPVPAPLASAPPPELEAQLASDRVEPPVAPPLPGAGDFPALALAASGRADLGSLPGTLYGGGLELGLSAWNWRLDLGGAYLARAAETLPTARYPVSYSNLLGVLRGCHEFSGERGGHFGLCVGGQLGSVGASETGGERRHPRGLWGAANLGVELGLELARSWQAFSRVELVFPLIRHELELAGGSVVHELPDVSVQLSLGAAVQLTEWMAP